MNGKENSEQAFDFDGLFVFDMANNHQGSVEHGLKIIQGIGEQAREHGIKGALKFQFRQLDTFIHPDHQAGSKAMHIERFLSTRLERKDYQVLMDAVRDAGLLTMCTPFDEESVDVIADMGFDLIKVASCSATDWPLLEKVSDAGLPVVFSTGGTTIREIDDIVSHFDHRGVDFAIMHCIGIYPTPDDMCNLSQISMLRHRYPAKVIGWSTHEDPNDTVPVQIAVAKGAGMFERHVGFATDDIKLNAYSSTPEQIGAWLTGYQKAKALCGPDDRPFVSEVERSSMDSLRRGVFAKKAIKKGATVTRDQVYFAMPFVEGQISSGQWRDGIVAKTAFKPNEPLASEKISVPEDPDILTIKHAVHEVKALLNSANVILNSEFTVEYSHHYGIENFRETGAVLINCINREYCKKILVQLPGQRHPAHFHKRKEETFQVLYGDLSVSVDGHVRHLAPGETLLVQPGVWHSFWTENGVVFEEVSTTDHPNDSFYKDKEINRKKRHERKTVVDHWGRFQLGFALSEPQTISE